VRLESAVALRYPDHPHDAEAIAVEPSGGIFIFFPFGNPQSELEGMLFDLEAEE
jgi:hypothetical protein